MKQHTVYNLSFFLSLVDFLRGGCDRYKKLAHYIFFGWNIYMESES